MEESFNRSIAQTLILNGMISLGTAIGLLVTGILISKYEDKTEQLTEERHLRSVS